MFFVYLLLCSDGTFYTGSTSDVLKRVDQHSKGIGAKYTRGRRPVRLCGFRKFGTRSEAMKEEAKVKTLKREEKIKYFIG